jgi:hypothetical protein
LYACLSRRIEQGEEINDCYIDLRQDRATRRHELLQYYRFTCSCTACEPVDAQWVARDDAARLLAAGLDDQLVSLATADDLAAAVELAVRTLRQLESADCLRWSVRFLPEIHLSLFQLLSAKGGKKDSKAAQKALRKAHRLTLLLQGPLSPNTKRVRQLLDDCV